jgi:hypothetical protein
MATRYLILCQNGLRAHARLEAPHVAAFLAASPRLDGHGAVVAELAPEVRALAILNPEISSV